MYEDYYFDDPELQEALAASGYYTDPVRTPAVMPSTVEAEPIMGIGSPAVATAATTGNQVINANSYSPSNTDLQTMGLSRDQWNETMAQLSTLDLGALNFGDSFGVTNPDYTSNFRTFTAPKSNKGNPTSTVAKKDNTFNVIENQPVRLVDMRTGKVVFQGTGYEAAEKSIELAAELTKAGGNKADWEIQTGQFQNPGSGDLQFGNSFKTVANEKKNTSVLNQALDIVGDAALGFIIGGPVGAAIAAGASAAGVNVSDIAYPIIATMGATLAFGPLGTMATIGAAAFGTAVSSAVQGRSVEETLIRTAITAATAGIMQGTDIGGRISGTIGNVMSDIGMSPQLGNIVNSISGIGSEAATREIVVNAATNAATAAIASGASVSGAIVDAVKNVVPAYTPSQETLDALNELDTAAAEAATDPAILVKANPVTNAVSGVNPIVKTEVTPSTVAQDTQAQQSAEEPPAATVTGLKTTPGAGIGGVAPIGAGDPTSLLPDNFFDEPVPEKTTLEKIKDAANIANAVSVLVPLAGGALGGGGGGGTMTPDTSSLTFTKSPLKPTIPGGIGGIGGAGGGYPYTPQTYGRRGGDQETEYVFFTRNPVTGAPLFSATAPATAPATAAMPSTVRAPVAGIGTPASSTRVPSFILTAEGYKPNPAYTADVAMQQYRDELTNDNYYSPQERQQIMSSIENAYAQPGATGEQISNAYQNASASATRARDLQPQQQAAAVNPTELSQKLLDRAAQVEAINQRYKNQYGLQDSDIDAMFQGTYGLNMADPADSPEFEAARLISSPYRNELANIYGDLPTMRYALSSPVNALGRTRDSLSQLDVASNRAQQSLVDSSSPEWEQQYLAYMTGATEQMPPAPIGNTPEEWTRRMETVRTYGPDIAQATVKNWGDTRSAYPDLVAAERAEANEVREGSIDAYNTALANLTRGVGGAYALAPITTPIVNEPAAPAMVAPSGNTFAEGGEVDDDMVKHLVEYHKNGGHQGPGQVKGIGSGQDDKIPAWLSDGEYVWSAQDVADLGDGSNDEGVRRLDKMRQMVRRQAGRKDVKKIAKPQKGIDRMLKAVGGLA